MLSVTVQKMQGKGRVVQHQKLLVSPPEACTALKEQGAVTSMPDRSVAIP